MKKLCLILLLLMMNSKLLKPQEQCALNGEPNGFSTPILNLTPLEEVSILYPHEFRQLSVEMHIVRKSDGTGSLITEEDVQKSIETANRHFTSCNIAFDAESIAQSIDFIDSDAFFNGYYGYNTAISNELVRFDENSWNEKKIDIYVVQDGEAFGWASYPWDKKRFENDHDWVFILESELTNRSTLSHELGHYFGLLHTHHTAELHGSGEKELVNRANCYRTADCHCDTPADPLLGINNVDNCMYTGVERDPENVIYKPNVKYIMSYAPASCRVEFSEQQKRTVIEYVQRKEENDGRGYIEYINKKDFCEEKGSVQQYSNGNDIQAIDKRGDKIAVATRGGIAIWQVGEKESVTKYTTLDIRGLPTNFITDIAIRADESLLIGTNLGLYKLNWINGAYEAILIGEPVNVNVILLLTKEQQEEVWIGTTQGLGYVDLQANNVVIDYYTIEDSILVTNHVNTITDLAADEQYIWATTYAGLTRMNHQNLADENYEHLGATDRLLTAIAISDEQDIFLGYARYDADQGEDVYGLGQWTVDGFVELNSTLDVIDVIRIDGTGNKWLGVRDVGLIKWKDGIVIQVYGQADYNLDSDHVTDVFIDGDELYVSTFAGFFNLPIAAELVEDRQTFVIEEFIVDNYTEKIVSTARGVYVVTLEKGLMFIDNNGNRHFYTEEEGLKSRLIRDIVVDQNGQVWISTNEGINIIDVDGNVVESHLLNDDLNELILRAFVVYEDKVWGVTGGGTAVILIDQDEGVKTQHSFDGVIQKAFIDNSEKLWVIGLRSKKLYHLDDSNGWQEFDHALLEDQVKHIAFGSDQRLWVLTDQQIKGYAYDETGILYTDTVRNHQKTINEITQTQINVSTIIDDDIYLGTNKGLFVLKYGLLTKYDLQGLASPEIYTIRQTQDGSIWIGTSNGITLLRETKPTYANFTASTTHLPEAGQIRFSSNNYPNTTQLTWWLDGDELSQFAGQQDVDILFEDNGSYRVSLVVSSEHCSDTMTQVIRVGAQSSFVIGDVNGDRAINAIDLFAIGLAHGANGFQREKQDDIVGCDTVEAFNWGIKLYDFIGYELTNNMLGNIDLVRADCNGDGKIDHLDVQFLQEYFRCIGDLTNVEDDARPIEVEYGKSNLELLDDGENYCGVRPGDITDTIPIILIDAKYYMAFLTMEYSKNICDLNVDFGNEEGQVSMVVFDTLDIENKRVHIGISRIDRADFAASRSGTTCLDVLIDEIPIEFNPRNPLITVDESLSFVLDRVGTIRQIKDKERDNGDQGCVTNIVVARDDVATTSLNTPVTIDVLNNDRDLRYSEEDSRAHVDFASIPNNTQNGMLSIDNTTKNIIYAPNVGFEGKDSFTYQIKNEFSCISSALVIVDVKNSPCEQVQQYCTEPVKELAIYPQFCAFPNEMATIEYYHKITNSNNLLEKRTDPNYESRDYLSYTALPSFYGTDLVTVVGCIIDDNGIEWCDTSYLVINVIEDCTSGKTVGKSNKTPSYIHQLHPNLTTGQLSIQLQSPTELIGTATIYNTTGQQMQQEDSLLLSPQTSSLSIDTSQYPIGTYFLYIQTPEGVAVEQFVKQ